MATTSGEYAVNGHLINGCQFKIFLYAFKLALLTSFQSNYQLQNEARKINLTTCKGIYNWPPFQPRSQSRFPGQGNGSGNEVAAIYQSGLCTLPS